MYMDTTQYFLQAACGERAWNILPAHGRWRRSHAESRQTPHWGSWSCTRHHREVCWLVQHSSELQLCALIPKDILSTAASLVQRLLADRRTGASNIVAHCVELSGTAGRCTV